MQILGGKLKGQTLKVPHGHLIRPMSVRLKRRMFDSWQDFQDESFWDVCSGSGAVGIEAYSRGASKVFFTELSKRVFPILKSNLSHFSDKNEYQLEQKDCLKASSNCFFSDHIFFAPPYEKIELYHAFLKKAQGLVGEQTLLWVESDNQKGEKEDMLKNYFKEDTKTYYQGTTFLIRGNLKKLD